MDRATTGEADPRRSHSGVSLPTSRRQGSASSSSDIAGVRRVAWRSHTEWLRHNWHSGQHVSVIVPTGGGKSYLVAKGLMRLPMFRPARVMLIDDKGNDESTRDFGQPITQYPIPPTPRGSTRRWWNRHQREHGGPEADPKPEHYRLIVPDWQWNPSARSDEEGFSRARSVVGTALDQTYREGDWVLILDEARALTDVKAPGLNLRGLIIRDWVKGRYKGLTVIALTQSPVEVPGQMYDQATHLYLGHNQDFRRLSRLKEIGGNAKIIEQVVSQLNPGNGQGDPPEFLFLGNKGRTMQIVSVGR